MCHHARRATDAHFLNKAATMKSTAPSIFLAAALVISTGGFQVLADGLRLEKLDHAVTQRAVRRSDNGKIVGMAATFGNSFLHYRAFRRRLRLHYVEDFDLSRIPPKETRFYRDAMGGAPVYSVENADEFLAQNRGRTFLPPGNKPTFVTLKTGDYVDGGQVTWICILSAPSLDRFYSDRMGHERCDAFR
ncbi:hypothetical protein ACHMW4_17285 [Mesorhizobium sp. UC22_110]|uniref:hypothetical protein n=1 Tax=Mesorhizobium sp. UC22_110 TaxID=3374552 RepID=UPI0037563B48